MHNNKPICIGILNYPGCLQSAVFGLSELFELANRIGQQEDANIQFETCIIQSIDNQLPHYQVLVIPPSLDEQAYQAPPADLCDWIVSAHQAGTIICSACAGAFILAATGLLDAREVTTHWGLADKLSTRFPNLVLNSERILVNDGDIITAGGIMSWVDLGLELVAQFSHPSIMRQLGKSMVVDTGEREQRFYRRFIPKRGHGDQAVLQIQQYIQINFHQAVSVAKLSEMSFLTERTFLRRFVKATGLKPIEYLQRTRIQKACDLIESSAESIESIASQVGYEDISAFRKVFIRITGLTPRDFRRRFTRAS